MRQRMFQQHQHQQHNPQHGGLPVSLPNGAQGLNAAQLAAMQANPGMRPVNLQMHLQQQVPHGQPQNMQQQQLFALQQAQVQAQAQANSAGQPGQHTPQRSSAQPPSLHETQGGTPQSQHGPPPGSGTPQPNPPSQPPSTQPPPSQVGPPQAQATPNPQPQQLPQSQQPGQPGPQPQPPQGAQGAQGQQSGPPNQQPMTAQEVQMKAQQQQQNANALMLQQRMNRQGASILCLNSYAEHLSGFSSRGEAQDLFYWQSFVDRFYSPGGVLRQGVWNPQVGSKQFEIATPALARYYLTQYTSGIRQIQMVVEGARERDSANGGRIVESQRTSFIYWFTNDCQLFTSGTLRAHFDVNSKIEMLDINVTSHNEFVPRSLVHSLEAMEQKQSPKVPKNAAKRAQQKQAQSVSLPESMVTPNGVPTPVMGFLEVAETISQMQMLFQFSQSNPNMSPPEALRNLVTTLQTQNPNPGFMPSPMNPGMQPGPNMRAPSINGPSQFASPAMAHLGLPGAQGSPHLTGSAHGSPAQSQLAGPPGIQGGMHPSPAGVSNSPNVGGNKRRRASTVKMESDETGAEMNGAAQQGSGKVKASPRVPKRQKGAAA
ncbi:Transcriptional activator ptaB [Penicillium alfredii]|uniref:Transcriptional activator ptaB n=1 Tax=Penicillium alfredii TaxID=1506179 RepID=A0A9W9FT07_9EURO|nr:Transcriptional activator ptaB [Penicillium alfredii]KAJ5105792.1 Transcriptional activator ptaB [Penicillium alfredii]